MDFISKFLKKSPIGEFMDDGEGAKSIEAENSINQSKNAESEKPSSKEGKISDESSDSSLDYGSANEDVAAFENFKSPESKSHIDGKKSSSFTLSSNKENKTKNEEYASPEKVNLEKKQLIFNPLTESFESPNCTFDKDSECSFGENLEIGQDPLSTGSTSPSIISNISYPESDGIAIVNENISNSVSSTDTESINGQFPNTLTDSSSIEIHKQRRESESSILVVESNLGNVKSEIKDVVIEKIAAHLSMTESTKIPTLDVTNLAKLDLDSGFEVTAIPNTCINNDVSMNCEPMDVDMCDDSFNVSKEIVVQSEVVNTINIQEKQNNTHNSSELMECEYLDVSMKNLDETHIIEKDNASKSPEENAQHQQDIEGVGIAAMDPLSLENTSSGVIISDNVQSDERETDKIEEHPKVCEPENEVKIEEDRKEDYKEEAINIDNVNSSEENISDKNIAAEQNDAIPPNVSDKLMEALNNDKPADLEAKIENSNDLKVDEINPFQTRSRIMNTPEKLNNSIKSSDIASPEISHEPVEIPINNVSELQQEINPTFEEREFSKIEEQIENSMKIEKTNSVAQLEENKNVLIETNVECSSPLETNALLEEINCSPIENHKNTPDEITALTPSKDGLNKTEDILSPKENIANSISNDAAPVFVENHSNGDTKDLEKVSDISPSKNNINESVLNESPSEPIKNDKTDLNEEALNETNSNAIENHENDLNESHSEPIENDKTDVKENNDISLHENNDEGVLDEIENHENEFVKSDPTLSPTENIEEDVPSLIDESMSPTSLNDSLSDEENEHNVTIKINPEINPFESRPKLANSNERDGEPDLPKLDVSNRVLHTPDKDGDGNDKKAQSPEKIETIVNQNTPKLPSRKIEIKNKTLIKSAPVSAPEVNFVTPMISDKNKGRLVEKKKLSPMSRSGDLMGLSPVLQMTNLARSAEAHNLLSGPSNEPHLLDDFQEEFRDASEVFKDPAAFDFLQSCGANSKSGRDFGKESLFVKFDPLVGGSARFALPEGPRHPASVEQEEFSPAVSPRAEDVSIASGLVESCSSDSSSTYTSDLGKPSKMSSVEHSVQPQQLSAGNSASPLMATEKPTQVVPPAINTRHQYTPSTPARSSPAIAAIDRLINLGSNSPLPPPPPVVQPKMTFQEPEMDPRMLSELQSVRDLLAKQEEELRQAHEYSITLQKQLAESQAREQSLIDSVNEKNKDHRKMDVVMEEYERTMSSLISEREVDKKNWMEEKIALMKERDEANEHLANMEHSFNDIHAKYEKCKVMIQGYKANEEVLKQTVALNEEASKKHLERYDQLRQHAMSQLEIANQEIESTKRAHQTEMTKLNAMLKKAEFQCSSLQDTLLQKQKDIEELTAICDDLINKVA